MIKKAAAQAELQAKALVYAGTVLGAIKYHLYLTGRPITYVALAKILGMFSGGKTLSEALGNIQLLNMENNEPLYSAAVVGTKTGIPGTGFFNFARLQGFSIPETELGEIKFWEEQVRKLGYDTTNWLPQTVRPMIYVDNIQVTENLFSVLNNIPTGLFQRLVLLSEQGMTQFTAMEIKTEIDRANFEDFISASDLLEENSSDSDLVGAINEFRGMRPEDRAHLLRVHEREKQS